MVFCEITPELADIIKSYAKGSNLQTNQRRQTMDTNTNTATPTDKPQSRIDKLLSGETPDAKKSAAGMFDQSELDRVTTVMNQLGMNNRGNLIHDAVMDAVERMEPVAKAKAERDAEESTRAYAEAAKRAEREAAKEKAEKEKEKAAKSKK